MLSSSKIIFEPVQRALEMPMLVRDEISLSWGTESKAFLTSRKLLLLVCAYIVDGANHLSLTVELLV